MRTISRDVDHARKLDNARLELAALFGNRLVTSSAVRMQHANTTTWLPAEPPDAVVFPTTGEEVQRIVVICSRPWRRHDRSRPWCVFEPREHHAPRSTRRAEAARIGAAQCSAALPSRDPRPDTHAD